MSQNTAHLHNAELDRNGVRTSKLTEMLVTDPDGPERRRINKTQTEIEKSRQQYQDAAKSVMAACAEMNNAFEDTSRLAKASISRAKDQAAQMTDAMNKITKMIGPDFEKRLSQLVTLTDCLERLAALDKQGKLAQIMQAIR